MCYILYYIIYKEKILHFSVYFSRCMRDFKMSPDVMKEQESDEVKAKSDEVKEKSDEVRKIWLFIYIKEKMMIYM